MTKYIESAGIKLDIEDVVSRTLDILPKPYSEKDFHKGFRKTAKIMFREEKDRRRKPEEEQELIQREATPKRSDRNEMTVTVSLKSRVQELWNKIRSSHRPDGPVNYFSSIR